MKTALLQFGGHPLLDWLWGRGTPRQRMLAGTALSASLVIGTTVVAMTWQTQQDLQALEHQRRTMKALQPSTPAPERAVPAVPGEVQRQWEEAARRLDMPWSGVFNTLERTAQPNVALVVVEPDIRSAAISITAQARTLEDLLAYARLLERDPDVAAVRLGQHDQRTAEPGQPIQMTLLVLPRPWLATRR